MRAHREVTLPIIMITITYRNNYDPNFQSWSDFIVSESGKNRKIIKEFLDAQSRDKVNM